MIVKVFQLFSFMLGVGLALLVLPSYAAVLPIF